MIDHCTTLPTLIQKITVISVLSVGALADAMLLGGINRWRFMLTRDFLDNLHSVLIFCLGRTFVVFG